MIRTPWTYVADPNRPAYQDVTQRSVNGRITWQINPRNKLSVFYDDQGRCQCDRVLATVAPEAAGHYEFPLNNMTSATWSSPLTSRTLLEVRSLFRHENWEIARPPDGDPFLTADTGGRPGHRRDLSGRRAAGRRDPALSDHQVEHLQRAGGGLVCHRRARCESGIHRHAGLARSHRAGQRHAHELPLQRRHAEPADRARHARTAIQRSWAAISVCSHRTSGP